MIRGFANWFDELGARVESATALDAQWLPDGLHAVVFWNFFGQQAMFLLTR